MPSKNKHTFYFSKVDLTFLRLNGDVGQWLIFPVIVFLLFISQGFAQGNDIERVLTGENSTIVYSTDEPGNVIITEGKITATEGSAIRLLPGTHIKGSEKLTVNIASKACQEEVAREVANEYEKAILAFAAGRIEEILIPVSTRKNGRYCRLPEHHNTIDQQDLQPLFILAGSSVSIANHLLFITKKITLTDNKIPVQPGSMFYTPVNQWGDCAGNIKVMRC
jgi:hypothetical protein